MPSTNNYKTIRQALELYINENNYFNTNFIDSNRITNFIS